MSINSNFSSSHGAENKSNKKDHRLNKFDPSSAREYDNNVDYDLRDELNRRIHQNSQHSDNGTHNSSGINRNPNSYNEKYGSSGVIDNTSRNLGSNSLQSALTSMSVRGRDKGRSVGINLTEYGRYDDASAESVQVEAVELDILELDQEIGTNQLS